MDLQPRFLFSRIGAGLAAFLMFLCAGTTASAQTATQANLPRVLTLSVDQRLLDVSWRCAAGKCVPWFLTKTMERTDVPRVFTLNGGDVGYIVSETRSGPAWPKARVTVIMSLPLDQRLLGANWACKPGGCVLSFLTRTLGPREQAKAYLFTDGETEYLLQETRE